VQQVMDVAPVAGRLAAGEDAVTVAYLDRPAQMRGRDPLVTAHVQGLRFGADDHSRDVPVAGQPRGPAGGDGGTEFGASNSRAGGRIGEIIDVDRDDHVGLDRPEDRQTA
jgi:hypothetical protein